MLSLMEFKVTVTINIYGNKLVNMIETKLLFISLSNLADILTMVRGSKVKVTMDIYHGNKLVNMIATKPLCSSK